MFSKIVNKFLSVSFAQRALLYSLIGSSVFLAMLAILLPGARVMIAFFLYTATLNSGLIPFPTMTAVIFLGKHYSPFLVAAVGTSGSAVSSIIVYYLMTKLSKKEGMRRIENSKLIGSWKTLARRSPFLSLVVFNAIPFPIEPLRFIAVFNRYSITKYVAAISLGRFVRYFLLATLGETFQISNSVLIILTVVLLVAPLLVKSVKSWLKSQQILHAKRARKSFGTKRGNFIKNF